MSDIVLAVDVDPREIVMKMSISKKIFYVPYHRVLRYVEEQVPFLRRPYPTLLAYVCPQLSHRLHLTVHIEQQSASYCGEQMIGRVQMRVRKLHSSGK